LTYLEASSKIENIINLLENMQKKTKKGFLGITLNMEVYPLEVIYGASYVFIDRVYLFLDKKEKEVEVVFRPKEEMSKKQLENLAGEFMNELLSCVLRVNLSRENKKIRQHIVERALFSSVNIEKCDCETGSKALDFGYSSEDDPLGIAIPWEEKYGKQDQKKTEKGKKLGK